MGKKRDKCDEGGGGCPPWMATFSDLMSLLLTFFVLLLSMASLDQKKIKEALGSLQGALGVLEGGFKTEVSKNLVLPTVGITPIRKLTMERVLQALTKYSRPGRGMSFKQSAGFLKQKGAQGPVSVRETKEGIVISLTGGFLFDAGSAKLKPSAKEALDRIIGVLKGVPFPIRIEGHTDDTKISTPQYPNNWALSVARAASVLNYMVSKGMNPKRFSIAGYGPNKPLYPNDTPYHRALNRRVDLVVVMKNKEAEGEIGPQIEIE